MYSNTVQTYIQSKQVFIQLVKPHNQWVNSTEASLKADKYHIITALDTVEQTVLSKSGMKLLHKQENTDHPAHF